MTSQGAFAPAPGPAPMLRMVAAHAAMELRLTLRNGEQLLLTVAIPAGLLLLFSALPIVDLGPGRRVDFLLPGILALAVMSTAFTSQAITTGFERRYGVLKRLGATPLSRPGLIAAKTAAVLAVEAGQIVLLGVIGLALGWSPAGPAASALVLLVLGTAAFSGLGLLMAGTLRPEATLAAANLVFLLLLAVGGVVVPLDRFPEGIRAALSVLPITALADGLRAILQHGDPFPWRQAVVLCGWALAAILAAGASFRWE